MTIEVGSIQFGEIDAKNELFQQDRYGKSIFLNSFQRPPNVAIDDLFVGARFFVTGQKGCGKTALMLHVMRTLSEKNAKTHMVLFKSDLSENERQQVSVGGKFDIITTGDVVKAEFDYTVNWLWLIYRSLIRLIDLEDVLDGRQVAVDLKKMMGVDENIPVSTFGDMSFKKITARAKLAANIAGISGEIGAEIEAAKNEADSIIAQEIVEICERNICKVVLKPNARCLLFFDKLELFWNKIDQKQRDLFLIRDLLKATSRTNRKLGGQSASFVVYASIRTEVLEEVNRVGPEIARDVSDFGVAIDWTSSASAEEQPMLRIVEAKINASEIEEDSLPTENVWDTYFPEEFHGRTVESHLLDISMFKPRLIVLRLNLAKQHNSDAQFISAEALEETSGSFSSAVWREVEEQILLELDVKMARNIKSLLTAFRVSFSLEQFEQRILELGRLSPGISAGLKTRADTAAILTLLYRTGALGQRWAIFHNGTSETRNRWAFRGHPEPTLDKPFVVHESLRKTLQLPFN